jgi:hypothetical protein
MDFSSGRKRSVIVGVGTALITLAALLVASPASAQEPPPGLIPEGDWTQAQIDWMVAEIETTEAVLPEHYPTVATYQELENELGDLGFFEFGATAPGGYDHWINPGRLVDGHVLNPEFAESLVYQVRGDGQWELKAAMFMLGPGVEVHEIPGLISWLPGWHGHPELCVNPDGTFAGITDPDNPNCPPGTTSASTPVMMHVWIEDPGCGHRFGGVGVQGLHCDVGHHDG